jgi:hypothetical protein
MAFMVGGLAIIGHGWTGRWLGVLIDNRNRMSLARLQVLAWTVVLLPAILAACVANIVLAQTNTGFNPLSLMIPPEVLTVAGLSLSTALGAHLFLNTKTGATPNSLQKQQTFAALEQRSGQPAAQMFAARGLVVTRDEAHQAQISDLFLGDETGNAAQIDVAKVQMAYITLIFVTLYAIAIGSLFTTQAGAVAVFPAFDASLVTLLGISQGGYLAAKLLPHSLTAAPDSPSAEGAAGFVASALAQPAAGASPAPVPIRDPVPVVPGGNSTDALAPHIPPATPHP